jgi:catechol 2,3-dioxygenase-like lactoylglutathione lyase family enzyme
VLSHVSIGVKNLARAGTFYDAVFQPLGYVRIWTSHLGIGYGKPGENDRLALFDESDSPGPLAAGPGFHLALTAPARPSVEAAYAAALAHGARGQHPPKEWPQYRPTYFAAFFWDPDGHRIEIVHQ